LVDPASGHAGYATAATTIAVVPADIGPGAFPATDDEPAAGGDLPLLRQSPEVEGPVPAWIDEERA
jgi:hypothetical protein